MNRTEKYALLRSDIEKENAKLNKDFKNKKAYILLLNAVVFCKGKRIKRV